MTQIPEDELKKRLSEEEYRVLRQKGTEVPFSGEFVLPASSGKYVCKVCEAKLFSSENQHESLTPGLKGWPSFDSAISSKAIKLLPDDSHGMNRTEVVCGSCGSHLGHLFDDETTPTGKHYCINSICLIKKDD